MAVLRDKITGRPMTDSTGQQIKITTPGEARTRDMRAAKKKMKAETRRRNEKARKARSEEEQLAVLDERLGVGVGAAKERARLQQQIIDRIEAEKKRREEAEKLRLEKEEKAKKGKRSPQKKK
jgi:hypothetical protein